MAYYEHWRIIISSFFPSQGAIELKVFSDHYKVELDVVDIQTQRVDRFGKEVYNPYQKNHIGTGK
jgi:hypothetical protein